MVALQPAGRQLRQRKTVPLFVPRNAAKGKGEANFEAGGALFRLRSEMVAYAAQSTVSVRALQGVDQLISHCRAAPAQLGWSLTAADGADRCRAMSVCSCVRGGLAAAGDLRFRVSRIGVSPGIRLNRRKAGSAPARRLASREPVFTTCAGPWVPGRRRPAQASRSSART